MGKTDINSHCGSGRIGKDISLRHTTSGKSVCDISVAMNVGYGERQQTVWTKLTVWGKQAEFLAQYAKKGDAIMWSGGQYMTSEFDGKDGKVKTHYFEMGMGSQVNLMSKHTDGDQGQAGNSEDQGGSDGNEDEGGW